MPEVLEYEGLPHRQDPHMESLKNRISVADMGTRLVREAYQLPSRSGSQASRQGTAFDELLSFVFKYFSDLPDETLAAAAESIIAILHDDTLKDETKKTEIEAILDTEITLSDFNEIHIIARKVPARESRQDADLGDLLDDLSGDEASESENEQLLEPSTNFVAINSPIRFGDSDRIRPQDIDAHWLETQLKLVDSGLSVNDVLDILDKSSHAEADLTAKLGVESLALAQLIAKNSDVVLWYTRLHRAETGTERESLVNEINQRGLSIEAIAEKDQHERMDLDHPRTVDLSIVGRPHMAWEVPNVKLPEGSTRFTTASYEQYNIPPGPVARPDWPLKPVRELPDWAVPAFANIKNLNAVQSRACDAVVQSDDNILLCAPTGAGKTNVALLALTRALHQGYKAVYVAPLKALVQEQVRTLQTRLYGHNVAELSGDQGLSREQLLTTDVLVATPEKWDIISRKPANTGLLRSIGLVIIDEIHLLHDEHRGSILENIVARHNRSLTPPRLVGLSATLPNYKDVARFLKVPPAGLLFFDARYRPVPLEQKYVGVTAKSPLKLIKATNEACVEKVSEALVKDKQVLVFVHSRKDTKATAKLLVESEQLSGMLKEDQVAVHHAGLSRDERMLAESGFVDRKIKVLVCTATLAWGVNLPAAVVIIKGTQYYDPAHDGWRQLQPQDILQMLGRAGRPGFDVSGLGVILTEHKHLSYFASVATLALPIQSHLVNRILDSLNAEISLSTVRTLDEAVEWLEYTFWHVRSTEDPRMYGLDEVNPRDIAHTALTELAKLSAIVYDYPSVRSTFQGQVSSTFYVSPNSVDLYCRQLKPWLTEIDVIRVFCLSAEFASLPVRRGEEMEISRLSSMVPLPVRDDSSSRVAKVCVLVQAYICRLQLEGFALSADMVYIAQSGSRLFRAIYQLAVAQNWSSLAQISLRLYIAVDKRQWYAGQTPFRQYPHCPPELIDRAESSQLPWKRYFDLDTAHLGEVLRLQDPNVSDLAIKYLNWFPRFDVNAKAQPLTRSILRISVKISPLFEFNREIHFSTEQFYLMIEDQHGTLLEWRVLKLSELLKTISKPALVFMQSDSYPPYLFARILSDRWLHSDSSAFVSLRSVLPPAKFSAPLSLDVQSDINTFDIGSFEADEELGTLQKALMPLLFGSDRSTYVGLPAGAPNSSLQEMVIARARKNGLKVLFITPRGSQWISQLVEAQSKRGYTVSTDLDADADLYVANVVDVEKLTRIETRFGRVFGKFGVIICDDLHRIGDYSGLSLVYGSLYELAVTRIVSGIPDARVVGFGLTIATARAISQWIGAQKNDIANLSLSGRLGGPVVEVRHWEGSVVLALRTIDISTGSSFKSDIGLLLVTTNARQTMDVKEELAFIGLDKVPVLREPVPEGDLVGQPIVITMIDVALEMTSLHADKVVLIGTERANEDLSVVDVLELVSRAEREVVVYTNRQHEYATFLTEPLPLESCLTSCFTDCLVAEIANGKISEPQDAVDWLASTYLYRRLRQNPSYYGSGDLEDWISDFIESSFEDLAKLGAVELREEDLVVTPLAPAHIASYHGVSVEALVDTKRRVSLKDWSLHSLENIRSVWLLDARVDLAVSRGELSPLFTAVDARQSLIQSVPLGASPLLQIPYIDDRAALKCQDAGVTSVQDFVAIEDDNLRNSILGFDNDDPRMMEVANFVNHYPIVDIVSAVAADCAVSLVIERDIEEDEDEVAVIARGLPAELAQREMWFVVIGDPQTKTLYGFKKVQIMKSELQVDITLSGTSDNMMAWLLCDSYIDADKEFEVTQ